MDTEKGSGVRAFVRVKIGSVPLIGDGVIEQAVAIDIRDGDASTDLLAVQPQLGREIVEAAIRRAHEERIVALIAQGVARLKARPALRMVEQLIVAHSEFMQLRPTV